MGLSYTQLQNKLTSYDLEIAYLSQVLADEIEKGAMYSTLSDFVDFNAHYTLGMTGLYTDFVKFVIRNGKQVNRKLTLSEFFRYANKYRIISCKKDVKDFAELNRIKVKKAI
jgi:hypothetical protein